MQKRIMFKNPFLLCCLLAISLLFAPAQIMAAGQTASPSWCQPSSEPENPSPLYDSILYSEIGPRLCEIQRTSDRVKVEVIGQSVQGRNLYLVTITNPKNKRDGQDKDEEHHKELRKLMIDDPEEALEFIDEYDDFNVPVFINGSIHGNEYPGTDACMRLIELLAYEESEEVEDILDNIILLINVVHNPDGRVLGTRANANGIDLNRDMITQSQPETKAMAKLIAEWNPMVFLDLHDDYPRVLIEPCSPPHNPNYEYDLYIAWAYELALAMEAELLNRKAQGSIFYPKDSAHIPYRDRGTGWDDWPPTYVPMYAMYHGSYGHTIETWSEEIHGVDAMDAVVWGALQYTVENKEEMVIDQIEIFRRGYLDLPQQLIPEELLANTPFDQYNYLTVQNFPAAYVIPTGAPFQISDHQAARLVEFLLFNGVQVHKATESFTLSGTNYPKGSYVVWMNQPKRSLANTILDAGLDLSYIEGLSFYSPPSVWSHPYLWGAYRAVMKDRIEIETKPIRKVKAPKGSLQAGQADFYAYLPTSIAAFQATNDLLNKGVSLYRAETTFDNAGQTTAAGAVILPASQAQQVARQYALDLFPIETIPGNAVRLKNRKIAAYGGGGLKNCLDRLGFKFDFLSESELNAGKISEYDLFINQYLLWGDLTAEGQTTFKAWLGAGGDYVGLSYAGYATQFAIDAGIADVAYNWVYGNAIVNVDYAANDSVTAGMRSNGYAFVNYPGWFSNLGSTVNVAASLDEGADFLVSGFWPNWKTSGANGKPVIVKQKADQRDVTLIGIDATFRGHPENTFRIVGNAIYDGLEVE